MIVGQNHANHRRPGHCSSYTEFAEFTAPLLIRILSGNEKSKVANTKSDAPFGAKRRANDFRYPTCSTSVLCVQISRITFHHLSNAQFTRVAPFSAMDCSTVCCDGPPTSITLISFPVEYSHFPGESFLDLPECQCIGRAKWREAIVGKILHSRKQICYVVLRTNPV
jgi:hypothetical protein